jgi:hypothetical protein
MSQSPSHFWSWFEKENTRFLNFNTQSKQKMESILDEILRELQQYNPNLGVQIGGHNSDVQQLIVTAAGYPEHFESVEQLINAAPKLNHWQFIALMPPMDFDKLDFENFSLSVKDLCFHETMLADMEMDEIAVTIKVNNHETMSQFDHFEAAVHKFLNLTLGEKHFSYLQYIDIEPCDGKCAKSLNEINEFVKKKREWQIANNLYV